jgi:hypothetical protein
MVLFKGHDPFLLEAFSPRINKTTSGIRNFGEMQKDESGDFKARARRVVNSVVLALSSMACRLPSIKYYAPQQ